MQPGQIEQNPPPYPPPLRCGAPEEGRDWIHFPKAGDDFRIGRPGPAAEGMLYGSQFRKAFYYNFPFRFRKIHPVEGGEADVLRRFHEQGRQEAEPPPSPEIGEIFRDPGPEDPQPSEGPAAHRAEVVSGEEDLPDAEFLHPACSTVGETFAEGKLEFAPQAVPRETGE